MKRKRRCSSEGRTVCLGNVTRRHAQICDLEHAAEKKDESMPMSLAGLTIHLPLLIQENPILSRKSTHANAIPNVQSTRALHTAHPSGTQPFYYRSLHNCSKIQLTISRFTSASTCPRNITLPDDYSVQSAPSLLPRLLLHKQTALTSALTGNAYAARENIIPTSATIHTVSL